MRTHLQIYMTISYEGLIFEVSIAYQLIMMKIKNGPWYFIEGQLSTDTNQICSKYAEVLRSKVVVIILQHTKANWSLIIVVYATD